MKWNKRNAIIAILLVLLLVAILGAGGFVLWANAAAPPMPEALAALRTDELVAFKDQNGWLVFRPVNQADSLDALPDTGLIIYPGGRVDYRAYAPVARAIAMHGYLVVIPPVPLNLAFLDVNKAAEIMLAFPEIKQWAVAGHSLGGVAASSFASAHPDRVQGIAFWASYPAGDMHTFPGAVVSISGSNDGLSTPDKIQASKANLTPQAVYVVIDGGNHSQFGYYGAQDGDNAATITREQQQAQIVDATVKMLGMLR